RCRGRTSPRLRDTPARTPPARVRPAGPPLLSGRRRRRGGAEARGGKPWRSTAVPVTVQPHQAGGAALVEVDDVAAGAQEVAERLEAQRLLAERRVHPLHLGLDHGVVQPFGVVLFVADPKGALEQARGGGLWIGRRLVLGLAGARVATAPF